MQHRNKEVMNQKEEWAADVLDSFSGIERATPSNALFDKILMDLPEQNTPLIQTKHIRWVAMIATVVIGVNVYVLTSDRYVTYSESLEEKSELTLQSNFNIYAE